MLVYLLYSIHIFKLFLLILCWKLLTGSEAPEYISFLMCRLVFTILLLTFEAMGHRYFINSFQVSVADQGQNQYHMDAYQAYIHSGAQQETLLHVLSPPG